jgi:hypothetical protein
VNHVSADLGIPSRKNPLGALLEVLAMAASMSAAFHRI